MSHHPERTARNVRPVNQPPSFQDLPGCRDAVHLRHHQVHEDDVRSEGPGGPDCIESVLGFADDGEALDRAEQRDEPHAHHRVIVDDEDLDLIHCLRLLPEG